MTRIGSLPSILAIAAAASVLWAPQALAQAKEIVVGAPNSTTGGFGEGGRQLIAGMELALKEVNEAGGIKSLGGATIKVISADTSSDNPSQAASVTRRLIAQDGAVLLVGAHTSTMTLSAQIEAEKAEVPIITSGWADAIVDRGYKYTFKIPPNSSVMAKLGSEYLRNVYKEIQGKDIQRVAVFYGTDAASQAGGKAFLSLAEKSGQEVAATGTFPSNLTDPTPVVGPILSSKPDALYLNGFTADFILIARALRDVGVKIPILGIGSSITVKSIPESLGAAADGIFGTVVWNWDLPVDGVSQFTEAFGKAHADVPYASQEAGEGYAIGKLIAATFEKAASSDPKVLRDTLASIEITDSIMPGGKILFNENGLNTSGVGLLVGWSGGELRTVWPKEYQSQAPKLPE